MVILWEIMGLAVTKWGVFVTLANGGEIRGYRLCVSVELLNVKNEKLVKVTEYSK